MSKAPNASNTLAVILGGDAGAYSLGLECYEAFGCRALCVANSPVELITRSVFFDTQAITPSATDQQRLDVLGAIAKKRAGMNLLLLANQDGAVTFFARHREELESAGYLIPTPTTETIDALCEKDSFARVCEEQGVSTPKTVVVDFEDAGPSWLAPQIDLRFPVVAKTSSGEAYEKVDFPGKKKIWFVDTPVELDELWQNLIRAGFRDKFLVQELIPGDDTAMKSLTFYVDSAGNVKLRSGAQVLLQDPSPTMIGNPIAMITEPLPRLWESAEKILKAGKYSGFANFDIKVDPRDGTAYFLEVNPRIGRNSYYVVAAGANPMAIMAADLIEHRDVDPVEASTPALYSLIPVSLIKKYVKDPTLIARVNRLVKQGRVLNPLASPLEKDLRRKLTATIQKYNYYRKFKAHFQPM